MSASNENEDVWEILLLVTPFFNLATTTAFIDPFRVSNYLSGEARFRWRLVSVEGGNVTCSNGFTVQTEALADYAESTPQMVVVSSSWTPEEHHTREITQALHSWAARNVTLGALDTGTFILARSKLMKDCTATVHYEHLDALIEQFPDIQSSESLYVIDGARFTGSGGCASTDLALQLLLECSDSNFVNSVARYLFHQQVRGPDAGQNPQYPEPCGQMTPALVRRAIDLMEQHLEYPVSIPQICQALEISQRQLARLFKTYVNKSPVLYYRDIRLDRARCLVTQTELKLAEVAVAAGFASQTHFTRAYSQRFGIAPSKDRVAGRVPFEFRAWPMHSPAGH
ncbi:MAG: GlxA family transcriptional regulator [Pseudomonadota bacterium]